MMTSSPVLVRNIGSLELNIPWAKRIRENIGYTLRKGTADKIPSTTFLKETKLQFQHHIFSEVKRYKIPLL